MAEQEATPPLITAGRRAPVQPIRTGTQYLSSQSKPVKKHLSNQSDPPRDLSNHQSRASASNSQNRNTAPDHCVQPIRIGIQHLIIVSSQSESERSTCSSIYKQNVEPLALLQSIRTGSMKIIEGCLELNPECCHVCCDP